MILIKISFFTSAWPNEQTCIKYWLQFRAADSYWPLRTAVKIIGIRIRLSHSRQVDLFVIKKNLTGLERNYYM
jgi:hypothetical protein